MEHIFIYSNHRPSIGHNILDQFPTIGEVLLIGHLKSRGIHVQRAKARSSRYRIRGRRFSTPRICRRSYNVPGPNYLWHADGNHKLIDYRMVIHAAMDGLSHLITYLHCADNNTAETVSTQFINATTGYGIPSRIRTDHGGENIGLWRYMVHHRGEDRSSYIAGTSVHNSRIETMERCQKKCYILKP